MTQAELGKSVDNPIRRAGDFHSIIETLINEGVNVFFALNESTFYLDLNSNALNLEQVDSEEQLVILSAIAQSIALAQRFNLTPSVDDQLLGARFQHLTGEIEYYQK